MRTQAKLIIEALVSRGHGDLAGTLAAVYTGAASSKAHARQTPLPSPEVMRRLKEPPLIGDKRLDRGFVPGADRHLVTRQKRKEDQRGWWTIVIDVRFKRDAKDKHVFTLHAIHTPTGNTAGGGRGSTFYSLKKARKRAGLLASVLSNSPDVYNWMTMKPARVWDDDIPGMPKK